MWYKAYYYISDIVYGCVNVSALFFFKPQNKYANETNSSDRNKKIKINSIQKWWLDLRIVGDYLNLVIQFL